VKTERRLVTDADAAELRAWSSGKQFLDDQAIVALLDTREELIAALEQVAEPTAHPNAALYRQNLARAILAQVRGE
jgi:hypothetical protein